MELKTGDMESHFEMTKEFNTDPESYEEYVKENISDLNSFVEFMQTQGKKEGDYVGVLDIDSFRNESVARSRGVAQTKLVGKLSTLSVPKSPGLP